MSAGLAALDEESLAIAGQGEELAVIDQASFNRAAGFLQTIKAYLRRVGEIMDPIIQQAHETHRVALGQKRKLTEPALEIQRTLNGQVVSYERAVERRRLEAAAETQRQVERIQDDLKLGAAVEAEKRGDPARAERILAGPPPPVLVPPVEVVPPARAEGLSFRNDWSAEGVDLILLAQAVAERRVPVHYLQPNQTALNQAARAMKEALDIPGVRAVVTRIPITREV